MYMHYNYCYRATGHLQLNIYYYYYVINVAISDDVTCLNINIENAFGSHRTLQ